LQNFFITTEHHHHHSNFDNAGVNEIKGIITMLDGWPLTDPTWNVNEWSMEATISKLRLLFGSRADEIKTTTNVYVDNIVSNSKLLVAANFSNLILQPIFGSTSYRELYRKYLHQMVSVFIGANERPNSMEIDEMLDFEHKLNEVGKHIFCYLEDEKKK
jgi:hypothetical protein